MSPSPARTEGRFRQRTRPRSAPARSYLFLGVVAALLLGSAGGLLLFHSFASRPVAQAFHAAFPEVLLGPGPAEILVRLEDPFTQRPLQGQVRVLIEGSGRRREIGLASVEGTAAVPFRVPALKEGGYRLVVQALGGRRQEELSADVVVDTGNRLALMVDPREARLGESVRVLAMARRLDPARPAAGEAWALTLVGPRGNRLSRLQGTTDAGGCFAALVDLPAGLAGRFGLEAEVGTDLLGYREIEVLEEPAALLARARLPRAYAAAGSVLEGEVELLGVDGLPVLAGPVRVGLAPDRGEDEEDLEEWVEAVASGPGLFAFTLPLPLLEPDRPEPSPLDLEARLLEPGSGTEVRVPLRLFLLRAPHRLVLETPARWVEGLPHRVRLEVLDLEGRPEAAEVEVIQEGVLLARGTYGKGRGLGLSVVPKAGTLLFRAKDREGRELCNQTVVLEPARVRSQDFTLTLEESVLAPGEPLRLQVHSKRAEDRLWVDLLLEGMVVALFPLAVEGGSSSLEIPPERLPAGLFKVRAWRWEPEEVPLFEVPCIVQGQGTQVLPVEVAAAGSGDDGVALGLPAASSVLVAARSGALSAQVLPVPLMGALALLPGTLGLTSSGQLQLLRALAQGAPLPSTREELAPLILESWSTYGPPILARAESHLLFGLLLVGLALFLAVGIGAVHWLRRDQGRKSAGVLLLGLFLGAAAQAQQPPVQPARIDPKPLPPWWFGLEPAGARLSPAGGIATPQAGPQHLGLGGQEHKEGLLVLGWGEWDWTPGWELRQGAQGPLWPGDQVKLPCWLRLAGSGDPAGMLQVSAGSGPPAVVPFRGAWVWHSCFLEPGELAPGEAGVPLLARHDSGVEFPLGSLGVFRPAGPMVRQGWSTALAPGRMPQVAHSGEGRFRLELFPGPRSLALAALRSLWEEPGAGEPGGLDKGAAAWGSLDRVLGWGRIALALLDSARGNPLPPEEEEELRGLARKTLERAWMELVAFEKPGGGFGVFPSTPRELAPSAAALDFLLAAGKQLPEPSAGAMAARTGRLLGLLLREDGSVPADASTLAMGLWGTAAEGRFYFAALVGASLARFRAKDFLFTGIEGFLSLRLQERSTLMERLAAAAAFLAWDREHPQGRALLEEAAREAAAGPLRAGLAAWNGAQGDRADLLATGLLAGALGSSGLVPEVAAILRDRLRAQVGPDRGWGDPWTSAACLEALLAGPAPEPAATELRLLVAGREVWRGFPDRVLSLDLDPGSGPFEVAVEGQAAGGLLLLTRMRRLEPWARPGPGPLSIAWQPLAGESPRLGQGLACRLSVTNTSPETIPRVLVTLHPSAAFSVLPERLHRAVRSGELARLDWRPGTTQLWLTHLAPRFTRNLVFRVLPRVQGRASLPPAWASATVGSQPWATSEPVALEIRE